MLSKHAARDILLNSEIIFSEQEVQAAVLRMAKEINTALSETHPLVLSIMGGGGGVHWAIVAAAEVPLGFRLRACVALWQQPAGWRNEVESGTAGKCARARGVGGG